MPLPSIALGLVIVLLTVPTASGYDVLADPLGWVLVLLGTARLPPVDRRGLLLGLAALAAVVSAALWAPGLREPLVSGEPALTWSVNLPQVAFLALLAWEVQGLARRADAHVPANWFRTTTVLVLLAGLSPAVVLGGGVEALAEPVYILAGAALLLLVVLLFWYARAPWARPVTTEA